MNNQPLHILLADDDEGDRILFKDAFSELAFKTVVNTVTNGIELMESLNRKGVRLPHLLFLDLNMPPKNGLDCLKELKSNEKLKDIFIAIYSTSDNQQDMEETFLNGANVYITKPSDFNALKKVLDKAVKTAQFYEDDRLDRENFILNV